MDIKFIDMDLAKAVISIKDQLFRYYTACMQARNTSVQAVENDIDNRLQRALENSLTEDTLKGGVHTIKYVKGIRNRNILFLDGAPFAGFDTVRDPRFLSKLGCPLDGTYNLSDEGNTVLEMINNFIGMSLKDFADKYFSMPATNNADDFLNELAKFVNYEKFEISDDAFLNDPKFYMGGYLTFSGRELLLVPSFINSNPKRFGKNAAEMVGDTAYYNGKPITSIELFFTIDHYDMDNFRMRGPAAFYLFTDNNKDPDIAIELDVPKGSEFLKALRKEVYPWYLSMFVKYNSEDAEGREREKREFVEEIQKIIMIKEFSENFPRFDMGNSQDKGESAPEKCRVYDLKLLLKSEQARLKGRFKVTNGGSKNKNVIYYSNKRGRLMVVIDEEEHNECFYFRSGKGDFTYRDKFRDSLYTSETPSILENPDVNVPEEFMEIAEDYAKRDTIIKGIYYR